jgi:membrane-associated protein
MEWLKYIINFVLHIDTYLKVLVTQSIFLTYGALFVVIFIETGLVVTPFLPGDSLLFAAGALAHDGSLNIFILWIVAATAAILGDTANYWIGHYVGPRVFHENVRWLKREYLERAQAFYEKHGGKTILLARFIPIIRTFAPFVAGIGKMRYGYFITYNFVGGLLWTTLFLWTGYFFGGLPLVERNFSLVIIAIVVISVIPAVVEAIKGRNNKVKGKPELKAD